MPQKVTGALGLSVPLNPWELVFNLWPLALVCPSKFLVAMGLSVPLKPLVVSVQFVAVDFSMPLIPLGFSCPGWPSTLVCPSKFLVALGLSVPLIPLGFSGPGWPSTVRELLYFTDWFSGPMYMQLVCACALVVVGVSVSQCVHGGLDCSFYTFYDCTFYVCAF